MRKKVQVPQWIPTALLLLLIPVIGYLVVSNIEDARRQWNADAQTQEEARLIAFMHDQYDGQYPDKGYTWSIMSRNGDLRRVCYCDENGYGWWYDVAVSPEGAFSATKVADTSQGGTPP